MFDHQRVSLYYCGIIVRAYEFEGEVTLFLLVLNAYKKWHKMLVINQMNLYFL